MSKGFFGDVKDGEFWRKIAARRDAIIQIKDVQAYEDAMKNCRGVTLEDRTIGAINCYRHVDLNAKWIFFMLPGEQDLVLMVRVVENEADAYVLYDKFPDGEDVLTFGNREDIVNRGDLFIFEPPENEEDFVFAELAWTPEFSQGMELPNGETIMADYVQEEMGTQYTELSTNPPTSVEGALCGITEFHTEADVDDPHFVIVEEGIDWDSETNTGKVQGGCCSFYLGCQISMSDIEVSIP